VEVLPDEQKTTTVDFLARAVGWFSQQGNTCSRILSDNGSAYRSGDWRKACRAHDLKLIRTKPYTPRTNGKAERYGLRPNSAKSRPCLRNGPMPWPSRPPRSGTAGCLAMWRSLTAAGATWPSVASAPSSAWPRCSLNHLVGYHPYKICSKFVP
jgi:hypothetical protein